MLKSLGMEIETILAVIVSISSKKLLRRKNMQKISITGYPRIGAQRELKKWCEAYFKGQMSKEDLLAAAAGLRKEQWQFLAQKQLSFIPANDFSFYDGVLDTAFLLGLISEEYRSLHLDDLDTYFAMARGYQKGSADVRALPMKKWFNTNYHYLAPTIEDGSRFFLNGSKPFDEYRQALELGIETKPVLIGPFTFLKLCRVNACGKSYHDYAPQITQVYRQIWERFAALGAKWLQMDEPALATDLSQDDIGLFLSIYRQLLPSKGDLKIILQTYFGDIRDIYEKAVQLPFDAFGLDLVEGKANLDLIGKFGFPSQALLFAGIVNGKNIWANDYQKSLAILQKLICLGVKKEQIALNTSCSLLHVPYTLENETKLDEKYRKQLAFAREKIDELNELAALFDDTDYQQNRIYIQNQAKFSVRAGDASCFDPALRKKIAHLQTSDFIRGASFEQRAAIQKENLKLPLLPTTTIGSFPQTLEIKHLRKNYREQLISEEEYREQIRRKIAELVILQEEIGLDVLVHGEFERNDMVEYFAENLEGFLFTEKAWVQSYGTRCVKPPIIWGDIKRPQPLTLDYILYAQSLTKKPMKGMLTGPVTILNWSFAREDLSLREIAFQIALAVRDEVMDLEKNGIRIIQIDEAALREKLPLHKEDWHKCYLDWAIKAFRLTHSGLGPQTQVHTHMCYSEFADIIKGIDDMDADVISFEAARSDLSLIDVLKQNNFRTQVGPGVYDIHSPRIPAKEELQQNIRKMLDKLEPEKLWINPDCGLKTRGMAEVIPSLQNMVAAAAEMRKSLDE